jgi:hypothetical protein
MVCDPNDNTLNLGPIGPPPIIPGLGLPFSVPKVPFPDLAIPEGIPEDIIELIERLLAALPGGILKANPGNFMKDVWDAIASLLNQIAPYLALYNFLQALLNMVMCIIDLACALLNPFKLRSAIRRLFKRCLPDFLNLFPWLALLAMILALLLLLLALIEYIIALILAYIEEIIRNLEILVKAAQFNDAQSTIDGALKIAYLLCLIEQLFAILIAFEAIFTVIRALMGIVGRSVCASGSGRQGDDNDCCTDDVCPDFIRDNPDGRVPGTDGTLLYHNTRVDPTIGAVVIRQERWQFYDEELNKTYPFSDIIVPEDPEVTFWPQPLTFQAGIALKRVPYAVDMTLDLDPDTFDNNYSGPSGVQTFQIKDIIVEQEPYMGVDQWNDSRSTAINNTGTLRLTGGKVFEEDGTTPVILGTQQGTLTSFIRLDPGSWPPSQPEDGYFISNIQYDLRINYDLLIKEALITIMCAPDLALESAVFNSTYGIDPVALQIGDLPNIGSLTPSPGNPLGTGALGCLNTALDKYRKDISTESTAVFQAETLACLNNLRDETESSFVNTLSAGSNQFASTVTPDPDLQFVSLPILVSVELRDANGVLLSSNIPADLQEDIADRITGTPTLGSLGDFAHDGYDAFVAELTSTTTGEGTLTVSINEQILSDILNRDNNDVATEIIERVIPYEFIGVPVSAVGVDDKKVRRDEGDVARDGE